MEEHAKEVVEQVREELRDIYGDAGELEPNTAAEAEVQQRPLEQQGLGDDAQGRDEQGDNFDKRINMDNTNNQRR